MRCVVVVVKANPVETVLRRSFLGDVTKGRDDDEASTIQQEGRSNCRIRVVSTLRSILFKCRVSSIE